MRYVLCRCVALAGDSDLEQLGKIFNVLGTPTAQNWPKVELLPNYIEFEARAPMKLSELFSRSRSAELELLQALLQLDPSKRPTATQVGLCCNVAASRCSRSNGQTAALFVALSHPLFCLFFNAVFRFPQALEHPYFTSAPQPCAPADLPLPAGVTLPALTTAAGSKKDTAESRMRRGLPHGPSSVSMYSSNNSLVDKVTALEVKSDSSEGGLGSGAALGSGEGIADMDGQAFKKLRSV